MSSAVIGIEARYKKPVPRPKTSCEVVKIDLNSRVTTPLKIASPSNRMKPAPVVLINLGDPVKTE